MCLVSMSKIGGTDIALLGFGKVPRLSFHYQYRTDSNVGRIVSRVATFRNIANDLLRTLMIEILTEYF